MESQVCMEFMLIHVQTLTKHLTAYFTKSGPDICYFKSNNPKQRSIPRLNQRLINISHLFWCYCGREVLFEKVCLTVVHKFVFHGIQFLAKQKRGIRVKHRQIQQDTCVQDEAFGTLKLPDFIFENHEQISSLLDYIIGKGKTC